MPQFFPSCRHRRRAAAQGIGQLLLGFDQAAGDHRSAGSAESADAFADEYIKALQIKTASQDTPIRSLSGGNQQKVILSRWLTTEADIILMDNPTQGIDVGAKAEIYKLILQLAEQGKTILINTLEIPEVQKIADRCVVFFHGQIQATLERDQITEEQVMLYATNVLHS